MGEVPHLLNALGYALAGICLFGVACLLLERVTPFWREIVENKNVALAILVGALSIGMSLIISAAVH